MPKIAWDDLTIIIDTLSDFSRPGIEFEMQEYSGRGMYGNKCVGFVTDSPIVLHGAICAILAEQGKDAEFDGNDFPEVAWFDLIPETDSMGRSSILYYRNLSIEH